MMGNGNNNYQEDQQKIDNLPKLKRLFMIEEHEKQKRRSIIIRKSVMDYSIGLLITAAGVFFLLRDKFDLQFNKSFPPNEIDKIFGAICILYGGWRVYRGYKKNYFR